MELRYKLTDADVRNMVRASSRPLWALLLFALLLALMLAAGVYLIDQDLPEIGWPWLAVSAALGVAVYAVPPIRIRRAMRRSPHFQQENMTVISDEGIESTFGGGKSQLQWLAYTKWKETAHLFVLTSVYGDRFIPKRVMSHVEVEELRALLKAHIPSKATTELGS